MGANPPSGPSVREIEVPERSSGKGEPARVVPAPQAANYGPPQVVGPGGSPHAVAVVVRPLVDLSLARAVEFSLSDAVGIGQVRLRSLSGYTAVIDAVVDPGVSVVSILRRSLPVAFDVTNSTRDSVTIELVLPNSDQSTAPATGPVTES